MDFQMQPTQNTLVTMPKNCSKCGGNQGFIKISGQNAKNPGKEFYACAQGCKDSWIGFVQGGFQKTPQFTPQFQNPGNQTYSPTPPQQQPSFQNPSPTQTDNVGRLDEIVGMLEVVMRNQDTILGNLTMQGQITHYQDEMCENL